MTASSLFEIVERTAGRFPERPAVVDVTGHSVTYSRLGELARRLAGHLKTVGVERGDRVGVCLPKSIESVASILGVLKAGGAYVPVDFEAPAARNAGIFADCSVKVVIASDSVAKKLRDELERLGCRRDLLVVEVRGDGEGLGEPLTAVSQGGSGALPKGGSPDDLAYILYTSGSTGKPKGVALTHRAAISFIDWCSETFEPGDAERFSSHAPFHFDLSILDLYLPLKHAGTVVLIGEALGKDPQRLASFIAESRITSWYSTPSTLGLLVQYGKLERHDYSALRRILFAGEVMPVRHLRALKELIPSPRYFNLYGPTETNVCTFYEIVEEVAPDRTEPYPIGAACSHLRTCVVDDQLATVSRGVEGELCVTGPAVMQGYWKSPEEDARVFFHDAGGTRWYRTGDLVREQEDGNYKFLGRRDRMLKRRGYRVEPGEIESALYGHPEVKEAAVVATTDPAYGVRVHACLCTHAGKRLSIIALKQYCRSALPSYMVPDFFHFLDAMPLTSTGKTDYQRLESVAAAGMPESAPRN